MSIIDAILRPPSDRKIALDQIIETTPPHAQQRAILSARLGICLVNNGWRDHQHGADVRRVEEGSTPVDEIDADTESAISRIQTLLDAMVGQPMPDVSIPYIPWPHDQQRRLHLQWATDDRPAERSYTSTADMPFDRAATLWRHVVKEIASQFASCDAPGKSAGRIFLGPKDRMIYWPRLLNQMLLHIPSNVGKIFDLFTIAASAGVKIDVKSAYRALELAPADAAYHAAIVDGLWVTFNRLSFGMAQSPAAFVTCFAVTVERLRRSLPATEAALAQYVDDSGMSGTTPLKSVLAAEQLIRALLRDGWWISIAKTFAMPASQMIYTGFIADFASRPRSIRIAPQKAAKVLAWMEKIKRPTDEAIAASDAATVAATAGSPPRRSQASALSPRHRSGPLPLYHSQTRVSVGARPAATPGSRGINAGVSRGSGGPLGPSDLDSVDIPARRGPTAGPAPVSTLPRPRTHPTAVDPSPRPHPDPTESPPTASGPCWQPSPPSLATPAVPHPPTYQPSPSRPAIASPIAPGASQASTHAVLTVADDSPPSSGAAAPSGTVDSVAVVSPTPPSGAAAPSLAPIGLRPSTAVAAGGAAAPPATSTVAAASPLALRAAVPSALVCDAAAAAPATRPDAAASPPAPSSTRPPAAPAAGRAAAPPATRTAAAAAPHPPLGADGSVVAAGAAAAAPAAHAGAAAPPRDRSAAAAAAASGADRPRPPRSDRAWFDPSLRLPEGFLPHQDPLPSPDDVRLPPRVGSRTALAGIEPAALERVLGYLAWFQYAVDYIAPWRASLQALANTGTWTAESAAAFDDVFAMLHVIHTWRRRVDHIEGDTLFVISDASETGWGAVAWRAGSGEHGRPLYFAGELPPSDRTASSTRREAVAATSAIQAAIDAGWRFSRVEVIVDSTALVGSASGHVRSATVARAITPLAAWAAQGLCIAFNWWSRSEDGHQRPDALSSAAVIPRPWPLTGAVRDAVWSVTGGWDVDVAAAGHEAATVRAYATPSIGSAPESGRGAIVAGIRDPAAVGWRGTTATVALRPGEVAFAHPMWSELGVIANRLRPDGQMPFPLILIAPAEGRSFWAPHLARIRTAAWSVDLLPEQATAPPDAGTTRDPLRLAVYRLGPQPTGPPRARPFPAHWSPPAAQTPARAVGAHRGKFGTPANDELARSGHPPGDRPTTRRPRAPPDPASAFIDVATATAEAPPAVMDAPPPPQSAPTATAAAPRRPQPAPSRDPAAAFIDPALLATRVAPPSASARPPAAHVAPCQRPSCAAPANVAACPWCPAHCPDAACGSADHTTARMRAALGNTQREFRARQRQRAPARAGAAAVPSRLAASASAADTDQRPPAPPTAPPAWEDRGTVADVFHAALRAHGGLPAPPDPGIPAAHRAAVQDAAQLAAKKAVTGSSAPVQILELALAFARHRGSHTARWSPPVVEALVLDFCASRIDQAKMPAVKGWAKVNATTALNDSSRLAAALRRGGAVETPPNCGFKVKDYCINRGARDVPEHSAAYPLHIALLLEAEPAAGSPDREAWEALVTMSVFALRTGIVYHLYSDMFVAYDNGYLMVWRHVHKRTAAIADANDIEALSKIGSVTGARHPVLHDIIRRDQPNHRLFPTLTADAMSQFVRKHVRGAHPGFDIRTYGTRTAADHDATVLALPDPICNRIFWWKPKAEARMRTYYSSQVICEAFTFTERRAALKFHHFLPGSCDARVPSVSMRDWTSVGVGTDLPPPPPIEHIKAALSCTSHSYAVQRTVRADVRAKRARRAAGVESTDSESGVAPVATGRCAKCADLVSAEEEAACCVRCTRIVCQACWPDLSADWRCPAHRQRPGGKRGG